MLQALVLTLRYLPFLDHRKGSLVPSSVWMVGALRGRLCPAAWKLSGGAVYKNSRYAGGAGFGVPGLSTGRKSDQHAFGILYPFKFSDVPSQDNSSPVTNSLYSELGLMGTCQACETQLLGFCPTLAGLLEHLQVQGTLKTHHCWLICPLLAHLRCGSLKEPNE